MNFTKSSVSCKDALSLVLAIVENVFNEIKSEDIENELNYPLFKSELMGSLDFLLEELKSSGSSYVNSKKEEIEKFGIKRIRIVLLLREMLKKNDPEINQSIIDCKIIQEAFQLIFKFPWNNQLHCIIEEIFLVLIKNNNENMLKQVRNNEESSSIFLRFLKI